MRKIFLRLFLAIFLGIQIPLNSTLKKSNIKFFKLKRDLTVQIFWDGVEKGDTRRAFYLVPKGYIFEVINDSVLNPVFGISLKQIRENSDLVTEYKGFGRNTCKTLGSHNSITCGDEFVQFWSGDETRFMIHTKMKTKSGVTWYGLNQLRESKDHFPAVQFDCAEPGVICRAILRDKFIEQIDQYIE